MTSDSAATSRPRVLVVDDDRAMGEMLVRDLGQRGFDAQQLPSAESALTFFETGDVDVVVTDLRLQGMQGFELCQRLTELRPDVPVIVMTGFGTFEHAVASLRAGASDFLSKPFETGELVARIERAVHDRALRAEVKRLRDVVAATSPERGELVGESPLVRKVVDVTLRAAKADTTVLITGESGTGKEVIAHLLHKWSHRASAPFVAINCAAMPEALLESELFGHVKGAFTDARQPRKGLILQADKGTLFLDEIGELPLGLQAKLLRVLQERVVRPVGGESEIPFDVRIVAATKRDLESAVEEQRFRDDLLYRLNVLQIELPPLRSRGADVLLLAQFFVRKFAERVGKPVQGVSAEAAKRLLEYPWPGNVRELSNVIERAVALTSFEMIGVADLPDKLQTFRANHVIVASDDPAELVPLEEVERRYILRVMDALAGNRTRASQVLGLDRKTLYNKLRAYGYEDKKPS